MSIRLLFILQIIRTDVKIDYGTQDNKSQIKGLETKEQ